MTTDGSTESPLDIIGDSKTRKIMAALNVERQSVKEIAQRCGLSEPTVYRRISDLEEHDLVTKNAIVSTDGSHYHLYECRFESAVVQLTGSTFEIEILRDAPNTCTVKELIDDLRNLID